MTEPGWAWFTTSYTRIPQIQRDDMTRPHWSDTQAAAYVLYEMARRADPEPFARMYACNLWSMVEHGAREETFVGVPEDFINPSWGADIILPEHPPEWLNALF